MAKQGNYSRSRLDPSPETIEECDVFIEDLRRRGYVVVYSTASMDADLQPVAEALAKRMGIHQSRLSAQDQAKWRKLKDAIGITMERRWLRKKLAEADAANGTKALHLFDECLRLFPGSRFAGRR